MQLFIGISCALTSLILVTILEQQLPPGVVWFIGYVTGMGVSVYFANFR